MKGVFVINCEWTTATFLLQKGAEINFHGGLRNEMKFEK